MIRTLLNISQGNSKFHIDPQAGLQLASLLYLTLEKHVGISADVWASQVPAKSEGMGSTYRVPGVLGADAELNVRVHRIHGTLLMHGDMCSYGMVDYAAAIKEADASPHIDAHVIDMYSPGGMADYTETFSEVVANLQKPVVVWVNQRVASAAFHIASGADEIMLSGKSAEVGSIGTLIAYHDMTRRLREKGIDLVLITASKSTQKVKYNWWEPSDADKEFIRTDYIDPSNELFHETVRAHRPNAIEEVFTGNMYMGQAAIDAGLADSFGTLEDAVHRAAELAHSQSQNQDETMKQGTKTPSKFQQGAEKLKQALGIKQADEADDAPKVEATATEVSESTEPPTAEQWAEAQGTIARLTTENSDLQTQLDQQQQVLDQLQAEVRKLGNQSAKDATVVLSQENLTDKKQASDPFAEVNAEAQRRFGDRRKQNA